jgi:hypothetical protein
VIACSPGTNTHRLGSSVPVWDASSSYASGAKHDLLVRNSQMGASLSSTFKPATSAGFIYSKFRSAIPSQIGGSQEPDKGTQRSLYELHVRHY